jgi:hypothetical protein
VQASASVLVVVGGDEDALRLLRGLSAYAGFGHLGEVPDV